MSPDAGWFAFIVAPKREGWVRKFLGDRGFIALAPYTREFDCVSRSRIVAYSEPVFPRYVFAEVAGHQWDGLRVVPFINPAPLAMNGKPYRLSADDVRAIALMGSTRLVDSPKRPRVVKAGAAARITQGALAGHVVKVDAIAGRNAKALMQLLGSLKAVNIPLQHLEAA